MSQNDKPVKKKQPIVDRMIDAAVDIYQNPYEDGKIDYMHSLICQVSLPRRKTEEKVFTRECGNASLRVEAGAAYNGKEWIDQPLPYGAKPRLVLVHICSEAVKNRSREINLYDSLNEFLKNLGMDNSGRGYALFKKQMLALSAAHLRLGYRVGNQVHNINTQPIDEFRMWLNDKDNKQKTLWPGELLLSHKFYDSLIEHAVPLDTRALAALADSPLGIDVYSWLAHRLRRINGSQGLNLTWHHLKQQFGQEYNDIRNFKKEFNKALSRVKLVYPDAKIESVTGGLLFKESPPPIRENMIRVIKWD